MVSRASTFPPGPHGVAAWGSPQPHPQTLFPLNSSS